MKFPYEINYVQPELNTELLHYFHGKYFSFTIDLNSYHIPDQDVLQLGEKTGFVQVGPEKYFFPSKYMKEAEHYYNFQARSDDVWVISFPRSGTTWTQELVWLLANNLDFNTAKSIYLTKRFPFFEFSLFIHPHLEEQLLKDNAGNEEQLQFIKEISQPGYKLLTEIPRTQRRFIKSHLPFSLLPPSVMESKCKIIYVYRNPKDVAISYYHLNRLFRTQGYIGDFARYWDYFERGLNPWLPYPSHLKEAIQYRDKANILFLDYEEMNTSLENIIDRLVKFLNIPKSPKGVERQQLLEHLNISNFRQNRAVNGDEMATSGILYNTTNEFIRNGKCGNRDEFYKAYGLLNRVNKWMDECWADLPKNLN